MRGDLSGMRRVLRLFALACLLLGVAYLGFVNELIHIYRQPVHFGLRYEVISDSLYIVGFCLAAFGFWTAASVVETGASLSVQSPEEEPSTR